MSKESSSCNMHRTNMASAMSEASFTLLRFCWYPFLLHRSYPFTLPRFCTKTEREPPFLCVHTELPDNKNAAKNIRFCAFTLLRFCETHHQHVAVVVAFSKTSVFVRSHWSRAFSKTSVFVDIHFWQRFRKRPFLLRFVWISVNSFANTGVIFSLFMYKNGVVWTGLWRSYSLIFLALHCCIRQAPAHSLRRCLSRSDKWLQIHAKG